MFYENRKLDRLNEMEWREFQNIKGIGSELAGRIVGIRKAWGGFMGFYELRKISGVGDKFIERIRKHIKIEKTIQGGQDEKRPKPRYEATKI